MGTRNVQKSFDVFWGVNISLMGTRDAPKSAYGKSFGCWPLHPRGGVVISALPRILKKYLKIFKKIYLKIFKKYIFEDFQKKNWRFSKNIFEDFQKKPSRCFEILFEDFQKKRLFFKKKKRFRNREGFFSLRKKKQLDVQPIDHGYSQPQQLFASRIQSAHWQKSTHGRYKFFASDIRFAVYRKFCCLKSSFPVQKHVFKRISGLLGVQNENLQKFRLRWLIFLLPLIPLKCWLFP